MKRYYIIAFEAEDAKPFDVANIRRIIGEDMPYIKVLYIRDSPDREAVDELINHKK